jgi:hypothetical protein
MSGPPVRRSYPPTPYAPAPDTGVCHRRWSSGSRSPSPRAHDQTRTTLRCDRSQSIPCARLEGCMRMSDHTATPRIVSFDPAHLPALRDLVNAHLTLLVPGWALTNDFIASHLWRNPGQAITDPWVSERLTLCALDGDRLVAAAHLLRYGAGSGGQTPRRMPHTAADMGREARGGLGHRAADGSLHRRARCVAAPRRRPARGRVPSQREAMRKWSWGVTSTQFHPPAIRPCLA